MRVRVRLFAILRDVAGVGEVTLELSDGSTASGIVAPLIDKYPALSRYMHRVAYAVNLNYAAADAPLRDGDEVALIPPVSGGC